MESRSHGVTADFSIAIAIAIAITISITRMSWEARFYI